MQKENKKTEHKSEKQVFSIVKRVQSFEHAGNGIRIFLKTTHNAWVHITAAVIVIWFGFIFNVTQTEWLFIILSMGFVLTAEAFNTALEFDIDLTSPEYHEYAKYTKDVAAGAVVIASITASIIGLIIFVPKFLTVL